MTLFSAVLHTVIHNFHCTYFKCVYEQAGSNLCVCV